MVFAVGGQASAQTIIRDRAYRSPQTFALEVKGGPYSPDVDAEFASLPADERPHAAYFGNERRLLFRAQLDYQFFQKLGTLAVGIGAGYLRERAHAFVEPETGMQASERSGDVTSLTLYPTSVSLVYRLDMLPRHLHLPLVPFAKVGLDYVFWIIEDGNGNTSDPAGAGKGAGGTPGWHAGAGLALMLDVFDPGSAQELDAEIGVNHTYVLAEVVHYDISGLGGSGSLQLGDTTWQVGLLFEF